MVTEVKLKRGWLTKDVNRASARVHEWQSRDSKGHVVTLARSADNGKLSNIEVATAVNAKKDKS